MLSDLSFQQHDQQCCSVDPSLSQHWGQRLLVPCTVCLVHFFKQHSIQHRLLPFPQFCHWHREIYTTCGRSRCCMCWRPHKFLSFIYSSLAIASSRWRINIFICDSCSKIGLPLLLANLAPNPLRRQSLWPAKFQNNSLAWRLWPKRRGYSHVFLLVPPSIALASIEAMPPAWLYCDRKVHTELNLLQWSYWWHFILFSLS